MHLRLQPCELGREFRLILLLSEVLDVLAPLHHHPAVALQPQRRTPVLQEALTLRATARDGLNRRGARVTSHLRDEEPRQPGTRRLLDAHGGTPKPRQHTRLPPAHGGLHADRRTAAPGEQHARVVTTLLLLQHDGSGARLQEAATVDAHAHVLLQQDGPRREGRAALLFKSFEHEGAEEDLGLAELVALRVLDGQLQQR